MRPIGRFEDHVVGVLIRTVVGKGGGAVIASRCVCVCEKREGVAIGRLWLKYAALSHAACVLWLGVGFLP